jgi:DNA repair protein RecN (Recombination protein N)
LPETQWSESGLDHIDFMVAMNKGQDVSSLSRSASGGELARLMLALKVGLASRSAIPTLIFDEIDIGVGGAVATAIGERLAALANQIQVLAITHSPQLAACAHAHFLVFKEDQGAVMRTSVEALSAEKRQDEVARMLSGAEVTQEARAAALRLLTRIVE